jgi:hypothetical protein
MAPFQTPPPLTPESFDKRFSDFIDKVKHCIDAALGLLVHIALFLLACYGLRRLLHGQ